MTPIRKKKKKSRKMKEQLDDSFLRRSSRISSKTQGYKNEESAKKAKGTSKGNKPGGEAAEEVLDIMPLDAIPPSNPGDGPAPHLPLDILRGVAEGFLQIQPESVSAALIQKDTMDG
ncbi:hypothetical protein BDA96_05G173200 [Sorghum bicolor]|uniref:Uncharacterized protein n=1 Tax=Sorghum bicolor TaxID=4558 RepID=A0A921QXM7_SORBI|nr:hypothetical protein BDA96_05G173200 [Sorghum bicolor]